MSLSQKDGVPPTSPIWLVSPESCCRQRQGDAETGRSLGVLPVSAARFLLRINREKPTQKTI